MSNLLEQAIIDAAALKEVAMKNAEAALIEKYSKEFKESVEKLLEQEDPAIAAPATPSTTPAAMPMAGLGAGGDVDNKEKAFKKVPSSFLDSSEDDNKLITIDFDELKKQVAGSLGASNSLLDQPEVLAPEVAAEEEPAETGEEESLQEPTEEPQADALQENVFEFDEALSEADERGSNESTKTMALDEEEIEEDVDEDKLINPKKVKNGVPKKVEENIEISASELKELAEELKVDINVENLSDGHMGSTVKEKREQRALEFAAARDYKQEEARKEEEKAMSDLKLDEAIELGTLLAAENDDLKEKLAEMYSHLETLKENVEKLSISNAKLLYTNKVLGNVSLNERQKEQIVENISKSTSVLEAKTIYNTLQSAVSGVGSSNKPKESLSEALIRGNSPFLTRKQQTVELSFADRMKQLAGIQK
jgi:hypothetical protein